MCPGVRNASMNHIKTILTDWRDRREAKRRRRAMVWRCFFAQTRRVSDSCIEEPCSTRLDALNNDLLSRVFLNLSSKDVRSVGQTCSRFREVVQSKLDFPSIVEGKELVYRYNQHKDRIEAHVLKIGRSIAGVGRRRVNNNVAVPFRADTVEELLVPGVVFKGRITFEAGVDVALVMEELLDLHDRGVLLPTAFCFQKGSNLQEFTDSDFIDFIRLISSIREVHVLTSLHFSVSLEPVHLLRLCDCLSKFTLSLEEPILTFSVEELLETVLYWRSFEPKSSSEFFIRRPQIPHGWDQVVRDLCAFEIAKHDDGSLHRIRFDHPGDARLHLSFHFH